VVHQLDREVLEQGCRRHAGRLIRGWQAIVASVENALDPRILVEAGIETQDFRNTMPFHWGQM
jgi:hypothetical protein